MRSIELRRRAFRILRTPAVFAVAGALGCSNIEPVAPHAGPITDPAQLYTRLTMDHPAVNLSTADGYNTIQLTATPRDALGNPITGLPAPTFISRDTSKVRVTAEGLVTAVSTVSAAYVVVEVTAPGPVRHADSAQIKVTSSANPPVLASFSIHPIPPDSTVWSSANGSFSAHPLRNVVSELLSFGGLFGFPVPANKPVVARATDTLGNAIAGLAIEYTSLDPAVQTINRWTGAMGEGIFSGGVGLLRPAQVQVAARTVAYGIVKADTVTFTITPPITQSVVSQMGLGGVPVFDPRDVRIAPYGIVGWVNDLDDSVDVTFDNPANVMETPPYMCAILEDFFFQLILEVDFPDCDGAVGNVGLPGWIPSSPEENSLSTVRIRQFPVPGVYPYRSVRTGATGRIVVSAELTEP